MLFQVPFNHLKSDFEVKGHMGQGQRSTLKVRSKVKVTRSHLSVFQVMLNVRGHWSGSKVTRVKVKGQVG